MSKETYSPSEVIAMTINLLNRLTIQGQQNTQILSNVYGNLNALYEAFAANATKMEESKNDTDDGQGENV